MRGRESLGASVVAFIVLVLVACDSDGGTPAIGGPDAAVSRAHAGEDASDQGAGADGVDAGCDTDGELLPEATIDPDALGPPCSLAERSCPEEMTCVQMSGANATSPFNCVRGRPCDALICPERTRCLAFEREPLLVICEWSCRLE